MLPFLYVAIFGHVRIPAPAHPDAPVAIRGPPHGAALSATSSPETPIEILLSTLRRMGWAELVWWPKSRRKGVDVIAAVPAAPGRNQRRSLSGEGIRDDGRRRRIHRRASASSSGKGAYCADIAIVEVALENIVLSIVRCSCCVTGSAGGCAFHCFFSVGTQYAAFV